MTLQTTAMCVFRVRSTTDKTWFTTRSAQLVFATTHGQNLAETFVSIGADVSITRNNGTSHFIYKNLLVVSHTHCKSPLYIDVNH